MKNNLSENIRKYRKERGLTQEQLAEAMGITTGAVYKWESELSQPGLDMIVELADFFDVSVDVLIGYQIKDNSLNSTVDRLKNYFINKDIQGLNDAEKALKKYPNEFQIVYRSALLFDNFGLELSDKGLMKRALDLFEKSRLLLDQNSDSKIDENLIYKEMAMILSEMDKKEQAIELLMKHNAGGRFNDVIGVMLAENEKDVDRAMPYLSDSLMNNIISLIKIMFGYINVYLAKEDYDLAQQAIKLAISLLDGFKKEEKICFFDKLHCILLTCLAETEIKIGNIVAAKEALSETKILAERFDKSPDYRTDNIRFVVNENNSSVYDNLGTTALAGVEKAIRELEDKKLQEIWEGMNLNE